MTPTLEKILLTKRGIALNPVTGETFRLVGPAGQLIRMLQNGADSAALLRHLIEKYEVDEATAQRDLETFLATLERLNWVEAGS